MRPMLNYLVVLAVGAALGAGSALSLAPAQARPAAGSPLAGLRLAAPWGGGSIADLVEHVDGAVVSIDTVARVAVDPFFEQFGAEEGGAEQKGVGSGFIIDPAGLIVTNNHVIRGATEITVTTATGQEYRGRVMGADPGSDLAIVKVNGKGLPSLKFVQTDKVRVGDTVVAIGSPLGLSHTVSAGIISATNRGIAISDRVNYIQTDAAINPGNSGGPLINMNGEVVGVNTAVAARGQGIGFAIPAWTAQSVVNQLRTKGRVERTWLGVSIRDLSEGDAKGVLVVGTVANGPARRGGMRPGDVVVQVDNVPVRASRDLLTYLNAKPAGTVVRLVVSRGGQRVTLAITLQPMPDQNFRR
jgi:serine protease Do